MDRLSQLRGEAGGSRDSTLDTTSPPSEGFMTANESSSKYFSLSEVESTFDISSIKDVSLASTTTDSEGTITNTDELISNLSPIGKKSDMLDSYKIGKQIEAANILSGGVNIFDDNDNSYDGDELVIDDNVEVDEKSNVDLKGESIEFKTDENIIESTLMNEEADIASKDSEVVLQIDGKNVDAIDIGNGLYLYRKEGQEELAAVQIIDDDQQQPSFKFLKVRENAEGNLEVYEEIEIEVPKEVPVREAKTADKKISSHVPIKDINKVISDSACNKVADRKIKTPRKETISTTTQLEIETNKETSPDTKSEVNLNGKMMKFSESRKSPVIGSFTPMTYHSTPNKEGIPLTKTMVDQQLHPNRHSDNVKKTIEVHTDSNKAKPMDTPTKCREDNKTNEITSTEKDIVEEVNNKYSQPIEAKIENVAVKNVEALQLKEAKPDERMAIKCPTKDVKDNLVEQENVIDSTDTDIMNKEKSISKEPENNNDKKVESNLINIDSNKLEVEEIIEVDSECLEIVTENTVTKKIEKSTEEIVLVDSDEIDKVNDVIEISEDVIDEVEPAQMKCETEAIVKDNTQCDSQDKTKVIQSVSSNKENNDIILIEDNEVDKPRANEKTLKTNIKITETGESPKNQDAEKKTDDSTDHEKEKNNTGNDSTIDQHKNKTESTIDKNIVDSVSTIFADVTQNDEKNSEVPLLTPDVKNNQLELPKPSNKLITIPTCSDKKLAEECDTRQENTTAEVSEVKATSTKEAIEQSIIANTSLQLEKIPDISQPSSTELQVSQDKLKIEREKVVEALSAQSVDKKETLQQEKVTSILENSTKADHAKSMQVTESQAGIDQTKENKGIVSNDKEEIQSKEKLIPVTDVNDKTKDPIPLPREEPAKVLDQNLETTKQVNNQIKTVSNVEAVPKKEEPVPSCSGSNLKIDQAGQITSTDGASTSLDGPSTSTEGPTTSTDRPSISTGRSSTSTSGSSPPKDGTSTSSDGPSTSTEGPTTSTVGPSTSTVGPSTSTVGPSTSTGGPSTSTCGPSTSTDGPSTSIDGPSTSTGVPSTSAEGTSSSDANPDEAKPTNKAVPFGKWTATNRKEFLDKIRARVPATTPAPSNQLKNSNDLNRRDVLKKIDSQRQTSNALAKTQEANKQTKNEAVFVNKASIINKEDNTQESKIPVKKPEVATTSKAVTIKPVAVKPVVTNTTQIEPTPAITVTKTITGKKEAAQRTEVNYQDLIDKTIDMLHRTAPPQPSKVTQEELNQNSSAEVTTVVSVPQTYQNSNKNYQPINQATLDAIEMKMNELHGIPFIERPPHELPQVPATETKTFAKSDKEKPAIKTTKIPNLLPFSNKSQQKVAKDTVIEVDSEDEVIEHEPITGDIALNKKNMAARLPNKEKIISNANKDTTNVDAAKKETIITEKDFDKFARRNSITYENCITVNFDKKEQHNVVKTVVEKEPCPKSYSRKDIVDPKSKITYKYQNVRPNAHPAKIQPVNKYGSHTDDGSNRNQSKLQKAYHSVLTAKRQMECPITIIEDKPVKVVFMENMEFVPTQLNVQGQELSPTKKVIMEPDNLTVSTCDSLDSDVLETVDEVKSQDEIKTKTKHQRKQVLTPVEEPELELIEPKDLGLEASPKKKRRTEEEKNDKSAKHPMRKKYYLLGSNQVTEEKVINAPDIMKNPLKETVNRNDNGIAHKNAVSAIDSLVKAAELLEHQSENLNLSGSLNPDSQQSTPVKRGRGRPRKYPLPDGAIEKNKVPSPQKKPRLIDAKPPKRDTTTDEDDSDDEIIRENWTMGKINENIVCPICNKLFRTENVVFKHVKHCTGPSPSRSDSDKRSPRRMRQSQESDSKSQDSKSDDMDLDDDKPLVVRKETPKKRKSNDSTTKSDDKDDIIVIEDTPVKEKEEKKEKEIDLRKQHESRKSRPKLLNKNNDLVCEFCGKTFRQLSYLVSHKLQHKKEDLKKEVQKDIPTANKSVYSCEICKKEFRKLHHLVQHRMIHNPTSAPARSLRKSSSEQSDKVEKEQNNSKQNEDPSAGFRCEPCDKSFRKLHHLVEHRETHDGINRQKTTIVAQNNVEKPVSLHQCEVCKKSFRKLHHLIEHKEQHVETSSEKSDDKSVKSSLSTRDIIHECSLCYMVFPNEHSLTKHTIICQRKKRQSKQAKPSEESEPVELVDESSEHSKVEEKLDDDDPPKLVIDEVEYKEEEEPPIAENIALPKDQPVTLEEKPKEISKEIVMESESQEKETVEPQMAPVKRDVVDTENKTEIPEKIKKVEVKEKIKIHETPKKKTPIKEKSVSSASKRLKTTPAALAEVKPAVESSDDDEVRYMLNPNFKVEDTSEEKVFMKVRAKKRSSLQIERPNSKDLVKRRTSLQHPPKIPRLKPKPIEPNTVTTKKVAKIPKLETAPSTDSDDSETIKYSFPKTIPEKPAQERTPKTKDLKTQKKILADKRKTLSSIAKRKSLGKAIVVKHKSTPVKPIKRRTLEVEHRCDCGQLFSSAALLSRHTTLAHTPPRIRRRRSPPPEEKQTTKPASRKSTLNDKPKTPAARKSSARSDSSTSTNTKPNKTQAKSTKKSLEKEAKTPADAKKVKPEKAEVKSSVKPRKTSAHRGVPVPEKMRKLMQKNNK